MWRIDTTIEAFMSNASNIPLVLVLTGVALMLGLMAGAFLDRWSAWIAAEAEQHFHSCSEGLGASTQRCPAICPRIARARGRLFAADEFAVFPRCRPRTCIAVVFAYRVRAPDPVPEDDRHFSWLTYRFARSWRFLVLQLGAFINCRSRGSTLHLDFLGSFVLQRSASGTDQR